MRDGQESEFGADKDCQDSFVFYCFRNNDSTTVQEQPQARVTIKLL